MRRILQQWRLFKGSRLHFEKVRGQRTTGRSEVRCAATWDFEIYTGSSVETTASSLSRKDPQQTGYIELPEQRAELLILGNRDLPFRPASGCQQALRGNTCLLRTRVTGLKSGLHRARGSLTDVRRRAVALCRARRARNRGVTNARAAEFRNSKLFNATSDRSSSQEHLRSRRTLCLKMLRSEMQTQQVPVQWVKQLRVFGSQDQQYASLCLVLLGRVSAVTRPIKSFPVSKRFGTRDVSACF